MGGRDSLSLLWTCENVLNFISDQGNYNQNHSVIDSAIFHTHHNDYSFLFFLMTLRNAKAWNDYTADEIVNWYHFGKLFDKM